MVAIAASSGKATAWHAHPDDDVFALALSQEILYVGGRFDRIGGRKRTALAALMRETGMASDWNPPFLGDSGETGWVRAIRVHRGDVFVGGNISDGRRRRGYAAAFDAESAAPLPWRPRANDEIMTVGAARGRIVVGGHFETVSAPSP